MPEPSDQHARILRWQSSAGNAAVQRLIRERTLQRDPLAAPPPIVDPAPVAAEPAAGVEKAQGFAALAEDVNVKIEAFKAADEALRTAPAADKNRLKSKRAKALAAHQTAVLKLATWTRDHMPPRAILNAYLDRTDVGAEQKVATLGQLAAAVARMEFLLGTLYHQGTAAKWETGNKGAFPDTYDAAIGGGAQPWCTKFAGYAYTRLGFQANQAGTTSEFSSGYRLREWSTTGKGVPPRKGKPAPQITATDRTVEAAHDAGAGTGSVLIDKGAWKDLRKRLKAVKTADDRRKMTEAFFAAGAHALPQAGDIVVKPRGDGEGANEFSRGLSHTMLVESFDASSFRIHTIEGNVGDRVGGRTIDLTDASDVSRIVFLTRMGTQFFGSHPTAGGGRGASGTSISGPAAAAGAAFGGGIVGGIVEGIATMILGELYSAETLIGGMNEVNAKLVEINAAQGWIESVDPHASVTDWTGSAGAGSEN